MTKEKVGPEKVNLVYLASMVSLDLLELGYCSLYSISTVFLLKPVVGRSV